MKLKKLTREQKIKRFSFATQIDPKSRLPKLSDEERTLIDSMFDRANYLNRAQMMNGPGYYLDRKLREFVLEYNNRVFKSHGSKQPISFNIFRDFIEPDEDALILKILPEYYFSIDINFALDILTTPETDRTPSDIYELEEKKIYHVSVLGGFEDLQFSGVASLALFGWAFIRHGDEVSMFALGARDDPDRDVKPIPATDMNLDPNKPFLKEAMGETVDLNHEEFYDLPSLYPVILLSRIDLSRGTTLVRYVLTERRESFDVSCDDREMYSDLGTGPNAQSVDEISDLFDRSYKELSRYADVFALMNELPRVVIGIEENDDLKIVRSPTELHLNRHTTNVRKMKALLQSTETPNFINVGTIVQPKSSANTANIQVSDFRVEQRGYWKNLKPDQSGVGRNGDQVMGKTWVTVQESWEESFGFSPPENPRKVDLVRGASFDEVGEVYVMRNPQHPKDVFKVGFTTKSADERAAQLESTSGQPDQFGVMNSWKVKQPRRVEGIIHNRLAQYRTNPRREFFKSKYKSIHSIIEQVIEELDAGIE